MRGRTCTAVLAAVATLTLAGCDPMDASELGREVDSIHSAAAEGALLAEGVAQDRTKVTFVRVHARELADTMDGSAQKIADANVAADIAGEASQAVKLATDVSSALGDLEITPRDEQTGVDVKKKLDEVAAAADRLSGRL